jgi:biopolymer transport protein TolR
VTRDGQYSLARKIVPVENLQAKLEAVFEARGSKEVFLRADKEAPYGVVVQAMAAARRAGATRLGIVTEDER